MYYERNRILLNFCNISLIANKIFLVPRYLIIMSMKTKKIKKKYNLISSAEDLFFLKN